MALEVTSTLSPPLDSADQEAAARLDQALSTFETDPFKARRALLELELQCLDRFHRVAVRKVISTEDSPGILYLISRLVARGRLLDSLLDRPCCDREIVVRVAQRALRVDRTLQGQLLKALESADRTGEPGRVVQILKILGEVCDGPRLLTELGPMANHPNPVIRTRVLSLMTHHRKDVVWLERCLKDSEPRVRADAIEATWDMEPGEVRHLWEKAVLDPHHRVVANALVGLHKAGDAGAAEGLLRMARNTDPNFRAAAAWAMGKTGDGAFHGNLMELRRDDDGAVRRNALAGLVKLNKPAG